MLSDHEVIDRVRAAMTAATEDVESPPGLVAGLARQLEHRRRPRAAALVAVLGTAVALAVVAVAVVAAGRHRDMPAPSGTMTSDAVGSVAPGPPWPAGLGDGPAHANPDAFQGAAIPGSVRLIAEAADPAGGLPWGLREFQTTQGQTCLQVGRVQRGTIGTIGVDGAWGNDHRFHPISPNAYTGDQCSETDGAGHAFDTVSVGREVLSAPVQWGTGLQGESCASGPGPKAPPCPASALRDLDFGLLGPDAVSITFRGPAGRLFSEPTEGPDNGYLIVSDACPSGRCGGSAGETGGAALTLGTIVAVRYRDGHVCNKATAQQALSALANCPLVGYVPRRGPHLTAAQVTAPIAVRAIPARSYCSTGPDTIAPCRPGLHPIGGPSGQLLIEISFTARLAVTTADSEYVYWANYPPGCTSGGEGGSTLADVRAGRRVVFQLLLPPGCRAGSGGVGYIPDVGPDGFGGGPRVGPDGQGSLLVGRFTVPAG